MDNKDQKMSITATYNGEEIALSEITVNMEFSGQKAEVDADTAIRRSLHLVYENSILRKAVEEAKAVFEAQKAPAETGIVLPGPGGS